MKKLLTVFLQYLLFVQLENNPYSKIQYHCVKRILIWSFSGPYFSVFGLNTEIYEVNLHIQRQRVEICSKLVMKTRIVNFEHILNLFLGFLLLTLEQANVDWAVSRIIMRQKTKQKQTNKQTKKDKIKAYKTIARESNVALFKFLKLI